MGDNHRIGETSLCKGEQEKHVQGVMIETGQLSDQEDAQVDSS